jgi:hypothetical protein
MCETADTGRKKLHWAQEAKAGQFIYYILKGERYE